MTPEDQDAAQPDPHSPMSLPGEPQFALDTVEVSPGVHMVTLVIASTNGVMAQAVIRPDLALTVARLLSEKARLAKTGIIPVANGALKDLDLSQLKEHGA